jgi:hypothetical protein
MARRYWWMWWPIYDQGLEPYLAWWEWDWRGEQ